MQTKQPICTQLNACLQACRKHTQTVLDVGDELPPNCQVQAHFLRSSVDVMVSHVALLVQPRALSGPYLSAEDEGPLKADGRTMSSPP